MTFMVFDADSDEPISSFDKASDAWALVKELTALGKKGLKIRDELGRLHQAPDLVFPLKTLDDPHH